MISDPLITEYAQTRSSDSFARLVTQYVDLVYSSARRQVNDSHHAEDVTQAVFILLAQKVSEIPADRPIAGWLLNTTRYVALNLRRELSTRKSHEQKAATMQPESTDQLSNKEWNDIAPLLDEGLAKLSGSDRDALLLRFTQNKSLRETGQSLGISEAAAEKRVSRAIEKLREFFNSKGVTVSGTALSAGFATQLVGQAPQALISTITGTSAATSSLITKLALTKTKVGIMTATNLKIVACITLGLAATGTTVAIVQQMEVQKPAISQSTQPTAPVHVATTDEIYHLDPEQPIRIIHDAPVAARQEIWNRAQESNHQYRNGKPYTPTLPQGPFSVNLSGGRVSNPMSYGQNMQLPLDMIVKSAITSTSAMQNYNIEVAENFPKTPWEIPGDIVYINSLPIDKTLAGLQKMLREESGLPITLSLQNVPRQVYVVKGTFKYKKSDSTNKLNIPKMDGYPDLAVIDLFGTENPDDCKPVGSMSMSGGMPMMADQITGGFVFNQVSSWIGGVEIVNETTGWPNAIGMREMMPKITTADSEKIGHDPEMVLKHFCEQTGTTYALETRNVPRVMVSMEDKK